MKKHSEENLTFDFIYEARKQMILRTALYYSGNFDAAEDIMQKVFLQLYIHFDYIDKEYIEYWLLRTVKNLAINRTRQGRREVLVEDMTITMDLREGAESAEDVMVKSKQNQEQRVLVGDILEGLFLKNQRWYEAMVQIYCLNEPQKIVAQNMGISLEVLHSMIYRAKKWIKRTYQDRYDEVRFW